MKVKEDQWMPRNPSSIMGSLRESTVLPPVLGHSEIDNNNNQMEMGNKNQAEIENNKTVDNDDPWGRY